MYIYITGLYKFFHKKYFQPCVFTSYISLETFPKKVMKKDDWDILQTIF